jgi:hypothetical protein
MKAAFIVFVVIFSALVGGCSKPHTDPIEDAFKEKFASLRLGMTQAEVLKRLGEPPKTRSQIEEEEDTITTESGPIQLHKGDLTKVWLYPFGRKNYTLWFATKDTNDTSAGLLFMQNVISVGDTVRIK